MEFNEHGFLEELLSLRRDMTWEDESNLTTQMTNELFFSNNYHRFDENNYHSSLILPNSFYEDYSPPPPPPTLGHHHHHHREVQDFVNYNNFNHNNNEVYCPLLVDEFSAPQLTDSSINTIDTQTPPFLVQEEILADDFQNMEMIQNHCKVEDDIHESPPPPPPPAGAVFNMGTSLERKNRSKKVEGQPSKNLMAERRRRKRLNDRLSMLRSIVPKISKMDRTSILGDTIDYMKELLEKINNLQREIEADSNAHHLGIFQNGKPNESLVRNSPKFDVERRNMDTRIEICCAGKPGLLLSTMTTLEALGLEIQQCVMSCFNDFSVQASCSEETEQRTVMSSEDIKQALFRNAGYGGRCL